MQPKMMFMGETAIHGLRGSGAETTALRKKFEKRYAAKPFERISENAYVIHTFDGEKPARPGSDVLVGYERALKNSADGYQCIVLPAGEYAVFDVPAARGCDSENDTPESRLVDNNESYVRRELFGNNFILECCIPEKFKGGDKPDSVVEIRIPVFNVRRSIIPDLLQDTSFDYISTENREFICAFDAEMEKRGYSAGNIIGDGICWGRNMLIYSKVGVKSPSITARIYMRNDGICLRLFLNNVTKHGEYIANAPDFINTVFTGEYGKCKHCKGDNCKFRKDYEIGQSRYEKCNGVTFEFNEPVPEQLPEYVGLFDEFYAVKKAKRIF